jgi:hypothetical protein
MNFIQKLLCTHVYVCLFFCYPCIAMEQSTLKDIVAKSIADRLIANDIDQTQQLLEKITSSTLNDDARNEIAHYLIDKCLLLFSIVGKPKYVLSLDHDSSVSAVALNSTGSLALTSAGTAVYLWNLSSAPTYKKVEHKATVSSLLLHPHKKTFLVGLSDGTLGIWDISTLSCVAPLIGHTSSITSLACSSDGRYVLSISELGANRNEIYLWDLSDSTAITSKNLTKNCSDTSLISFITFRNHCQALMFTAICHLPYLWDLSKPLPVAHYDSNEAKTLSSAQLLQAQARSNPFNQPRIRIFDKVEQVHNVRDIAFTADKRLALLALLACNKAILLNLSQDLTLKQRVLLAKLQFFLKIDYTLSNALPLLNNQYFKDIFFSLEEDLKANLTKRFAQYNLKVT